MSHTNDDSRIELQGFWQIKLDSKLRLTLPTSLQAKIPESEERKFFLTYGLEKNFILRPASSWARFKADFLDKLSYNHPSGRRLLKRHTAGITELQADSNWRINLPTRFCERLGIQKDIVLHGFDDLIEIWDLQAYDDAMVSIDEEMTPEMERQYLQDIESQNH